MCKLVKALAVLAMLVAASACSSTGSRPTPSAPKAVSLKWTQSTELEDGSPLTDLKEYRLEYGSSGSYDKKLSLPPTATKYVLQVPGGTWAFRVVAVSLSKGEGVSNSVSVTR